MKKFLIAISVLAALMFSVVPSQALIGVPDTDVLGADAVVPFIADLPGMGNLNTLIVFTDARLGWNVAAPGAEYHYGIFTVESNIVYNSSVNPTRGDIWSTDALTEIGNMAPALAAQLEVDLDGDGTNDHYAGYIYYDRSNLRNNAMSDAVNSVGGQFMLVDLVNGVACCQNIPMKEWNGAISTYPIPGIMNGIMINPFPAHPFQGIELFSPYAFANARRLQNGTTPIAPINPTLFGLYPRFYIPTASGINWLMIWKSATNAVAPIPGPLPADPLHCNWYDNEENAVSSNIYFPDELNIIDLEPLLPLVLFPAATYPKEGWIEMDWVPTALNRGVEILAWNYMMDFGAANESWTVINPLWRFVLP